MRYPNTMRLVLSVFIILSLGCTRPPVKKEEPGPAPRPPTATKRKTMICSSQKQIKVAVIDTGFGYKKSGDASVLCKEGHKDFTATQRFVGNSKIHGIPMDLHGHGTNIAGVIAKYAEGGNFCLVILKYYDESNAEWENIQNTIKAIKYSTEIGADIINYSGGGIRPLQSEIDAVKEYLDKGGKFIAAAGNEKSDLAQNPYYPAMDDSRIIVVGSRGHNGLREEYSNYGDRVNQWEMGTNQVGYGVSMTGTSQAAAVATGKYISRKICHIPIDTDSN